MPEGAISVTRPGPYGNPFCVVPHFKPGRSVATQYIAVPSVEDAIECFRLYAIERLEKNPHWLDELRGKDLACWCKIDQPCHASVLLEIANR